MTDERKSGAALIAGTVAGMITMALHPTGHNLLTPGQFDVMARMLVAVHALALAAVPVLFLGAWGLSRRLAHPNRLAIAALVFYALGLVGVSIAAVADGLIAPVLFRQMLAAAPNSADLWHAVINYNFRVNQAFAQLYVVASSVAVLLWSVASFRLAVFGRNLAIYGMALGPLTILALFSGHLPLNVHGFGMVMLGQTIWFVTVGVLLFRETPAPG